MRFATELLAKIEDFSTADSIQYSFPFTETPPTYDSSYFNFSPNPLGSYTTNRLGDAPRTTNITVSANFMNGSVIYPGETGSALKMFHDVTAENGYQMGLGYELGKVVPSMGGGICQTTTTLYNAVIRAELTVVNRRSHSMIISYVPPALDATVDYPSGLDFTFVNSSNYPIYIESYVSGDSVTVNIWGVEQRPSNRTITFTSDTVTEYTCQIHCTIRLWMTAFVRLEELMLHISKRQQLTLILDLRQSRINIYLSMEWSNLLSR